MKIRLSRPCVDDPTKYIAECNFERKIDIKKLCNFLKSISVKDLKCSTRLGVLRFEFEGKSVMIYKTGRVDIRKIENIDDAKEMLEKIEKII